MYESSVTGFQGTKKKKFSNTSSHVSYSNSLPVLHMLLFSHCYKMAGNAYLDNVRHIVSSTIIPGLSSMAVGVQRTLLSE